MSNRPSIESIKADLRRMSQSEDDREEKIRNCEMDLEDCSLSMWANDSMMSLRRVQLELAENGWTDEFTVLTDLDGNEVEGARCVSFKGNYGWQTKWVVNHPNGKTEWLPYTGHNSMTPRKIKNLEKKGYRTAIARKPAYAVLECSNGVNCFVNVLRDFKAEEAC